MSATWILVANSSTARLYVNQGPKKGLSKVRDFEHAESRGKGSELVSDRPGHNRGHGNGHGAFNPGMEPKQNEANHFAIELAKELEKGRAASHYQRLILVAAPAFMGMLNSHIGAHVKGLVTDSFEKDYTKANEKELAGHLEGCIFL